MAGCGWRRRAATPKKYMESWRICSRFGLTISPFKTTKPIRGCCFVPPAASETNSQAATIEKLAEKLIQREPQSLPHRTLLALALLRTGTRRRHAPGYIPNYRSGKMQSRLRRWPCTPPFWLLLRTWKTPKPKQRSLSETNFFPKNKRLLKAYRVAKSHRFPGTLLTTSHYRRFVVTSVLSWHILH